MNIHNLYVTQRKLRNPGQVAVLAAAIKAGEPLPPVVLAECPDGTVEIEDGHHRTLAYKAAGRECLETGEYLLLQRDLSRKRRFGKIADLEERIRGNL